MAEADTSPPVQGDADELERARREKMRRWQSEHGIDPWGRRVDGLVALADARACFDQSTHEAYVQAREQGDPPDPDPRPRARVAGRCVQHRAMGKLVFLVLRDDSGDLQISISKADLDGAGFALARSLDYGDVVVAEGPVGMTKKGEICIWADRFELACKSLVPPPEKYHGLTDPELRYRHRYVDMYANPETMEVFKARSRIVSEVRRFMDGRGYLEVETPIMQPIAGGAAARPFVTHHNAMDIELYMRIAPELYLKRLLVGGMPRVYEISRNFRNEGIDWQHNPEFTQMEAYEAFGDCLTMLELIESLIRELAMSFSPDGKLPFGDVTVDYASPFDRVAYGDLFEKVLGFPMTDVDKVRRKAAELAIEKAASMDQWLLVNEVYERCCEPSIDAARPTFVTDYPSAISPLTRPQKERPELCERWELLIGQMELGTAYTELNDPDLQQEIFARQLAGADDEQQTFRTMDEDFLNALRVGMPPAGGVGLGIDRLVMLMTGTRSVRDVILFPLLRPQ
ncbi:MAG: lysine--tRNA ligase [Planctomycetota bacterium]|jgi:lysyl-tRNA synthetase class 2